MNKKFFKISGVTIIETLVALVVIVFAFTSTYLIIVSSIKSNSDLNQNKIANDVAEQVLNNKIKNSSFSTLFNKIKNSNNALMESGYTYSVENSQGALKSAYPSLDKVKNPSVKVTLFPVKDTSQTDTYSKSMLGVNIKVYWGNPGETNKTHMTQLSTIITDKGLNDQKIAFNAPLTIPTPGATTTPSSSSSSSASPSSTPTPSSSSPSNCTAYGQQCNLGTDCCSKICAIFNPNITGATWEGKWCK